MSTMLDNIHVFIRMHAINCILMILIMLRRGRRITQLEDVYGNTCYSYKWLMIGSQGDCHLTREASAPIYSKK